MFLPPPRPEVKNPLVEAGFSWLDWLKGKK